MENIELNLIGLLQFLLPGFVAAWIFHSLSSFPKQSQFERVVQALIFTIIIQALAFLTKELSFLIGNFYLLGAWRADLDIVLLLICSFVLA